MTTKAGEVCHAYEPGVLPWAPCGTCGHLWVLHTKAERGCAGCEAIAEAIKAASGNPATWFVGGTQ